MSYDFFFSSPSTIFLEHFSIQFSIQFEESTTMDQSIGNFSGLSTSAKNTYGKILLEGQPDNFDYQGWIDQCDDPEAKLRRSADLLELKSAGLVQFEIELFNMRLSQRRSLARAMETAHQSEKCADEPNSKRAKIEVECPSTSPKAAVNDDDCPLTMLPPDLLAKLLINHIPIFEWPKLELLPPFQPAVMEAWRKVRSVNVERDCTIRLLNDQDPSSRGKTIAAIKSIIQKLVLRSPFLTSLSGFDIPRAEDDGETNSDVAQLLAQFEHLESITMGDADLLKGVPLEALVEFLETTRSRMSLRELNVRRVHERPHEDGTSQDRFVAALLNGREIRSPLKLQKISIGTKDRLYLRLDNIDTSRLTDIRLGKVWIEPEHWISLIERASKLRWIELSFLKCRGVSSNNRLQDNKALLSALASRECLSAVEFGFRGDCNANCNCMHIEQEFLQMLITIGARGQLLKLAMDDSFRSSPHNIDMDRVMTTICRHIPSLRSIKITPKSDEAISDIIHLRELEEIDFKDPLPPQLSPNIVPSIAKLPRLKCFGLNFGQDNIINDEQMSAFECLAKATRLVDLRIGGAPWISAGVLEKWSNTIAPNLEVLMLDRSLGDEGCLASLLEKAIRLRILVLVGLVTDRMLEAIANSCPELEILGISDYEFMDDPDSDISEVTLQRVQQIVDNCPKLRRLGGDSDEIWKSLQIPKGRKIVYNVDTVFCGVGLDPCAYD